jgi:CheY-like chemotaxis protein
MKGAMTILIAEDDMGHAALIQKNLRRAGINNEIIHFKDGQETLDFLYGDSAQQKFQNGTSYLLLLDIRMPKADGVEVLRRVKEDQRLKKMPVIMITTTDDPREVAHCHELGCSNYITKPIEYDNFVEAIRQLGLFLMVVEVPEIDGESVKN